MNHTNTKNILFIGGTGIVGGVAAAVLSDAEYKVHVVGLKEISDFHYKIKQYRFDRNKKIDFKKSISEITKRIGHWDIVFDIICSKDSDAQQTCNLFADPKTRLVFLSTTLVYTRNKETDFPLPSVYPLASLGEMGGYVDKKIEMENYIHTQTLPWTILRPYHIVGPGSLLGCIPGHNRDPELVARLQRGEALSLCNGGDIDFNIVHPADIGRAVLAVAENPATIHKAYNCVNPEPVKARDYYAEIARQVGGTLKIKSKSYQEVWDEQGGWELTSLPHVYDVSDLERDTGFVPRVSYQECIRDALAHPPVVSGGTSTIPVHQRMTALPRPRRFSWLPN